MNTKIIQHHKHKETTNQQQQQQHNTENRYINEMCNEPSRAEPSHEALTSSDWPCWTVVASVCCFSFRGAEGGAIMLAFLRWTPAGWSLLPGSLLGLGCFTMLCCKCSMSTCSIWRDHVSITKSSTATCIDSKQSTRCGHGNYSSIRRSTQEEGEPLSSKPRW